MKIIVFILAASTAASASSRSILDWFHKKQAVPGCNETVKQVKITTTGEIIEGPACVEATVNSLRYSNVIRRTVSEVQGPDLFGALSKPPAPIAVEDTVATNAARTTKNTTLTTTLDNRTRIRAQRLAPVDQVDANFRQIQAAVDSSDPLIAEDQRQVRDAKTTVNHQIIVLKAIVQSSDAVLQGGAQNLITRAKADIHDFQDVKWPNVEDTLATINKNVQDLNSLHQMDGWSDWNANNAHSKEYDATMQRAMAQKAAEETIAPATDAYTTLSQQIAVIQQWTQFINALTPEMFQATEDVSCGALFNLTRNNTLQLSQTDRLPTLDLKSPTTASIDNWVVVRCSNPFSVSAGIIFSFVSDNEFGIVASKGPNDSSGNPTTVNKFQRTAISDVPKLPIGLAHVRIWETENKEFAFHGSFGVAAHARSSSQGGSDPEYLFGGSISLLRTMFITGGPYWASRVKLGGGFNEGDIVPASVSAPPLQKQGVRGWALAISFTKP